MVQLLAGIISLRRVREANPGPSHSSADTLPLQKKVAHQPICLGKPTEQQYNTAAHKVLPALR